MVLDVDHCRWSCCIFDGRSASLSNRFIKLEQKGLVVIFGFSFLVSEHGSVSANLVEPVDS